MSEAQKGPQQNALERELGLDGRSDRRRALLRWAVGLVVVGLAAGLYLRYGAERGAEGPRYVTESVTRGELVVSVSATGNLQPTNKVDVGSELSGTIEAVLVDDNDRVKRGQILARLDTARLRDQVAKSRAMLTSAEAKVLQARAGLDQARSNLERLREVERLSGGKVPSKAELDNAEATLARASADQAVAHASVAEVRAVLSSDETNLSKGAIRSPIDGVVLNRRVDQGQTVAASFQAPILFTLAETLSQMELQVDVDEADVGQVNDDQRASFTVDAYSGRRYPARVQRVGLGSQVKEGVVSYLTVLSVDNQDLSLRPGMTATAEIITAERENALLIPNAALRYTPAANKGDASPPKGKSIVGSLIPHPPSPPPRKPVPAAGDKAGAQQIWVLRDGAPVAVQVTTGATNGRHTEILSGDIEPGMQVITEVLEPRKCARPDTSR
jgi:HlyD family secretion protein